MWDCRGLGSQGSRLTSQQGQPLLSLEQGERQEWQLYGR